MYPLYRNQFIFRTAAFLEIAGQNGTINFRLGLFNAGCFVQTIKESSKLGCNLDEKKRGWTKKSAFL
jgi:hypothetical protein